MRMTLLVMFTSALCVAALAQPKPPETPKPPEPARAGEQRTPPATAARPQTAPSPAAAPVPLAGPGVAVGAGQPAAGRPAATVPAATPPATATPAPAGTAQSAVNQALVWEGRWFGTFGARTDMTVTVSGGRITAVTLLGVPMTVTSSTVTAMSASASGPDFKIDLARFTQTAGQGIYENARREKAIAVFQKM